MTVEESILIESDSILKVAIDRSWTANDFKNLFDSLNRLYGYTYHIDRSLEKFKLMEKEFNWGDKYSKLPQYINFSADFKHLAVEILKNENLHDYLPSKYSLIISPIFQLLIRKITFGSKGSIDLIGIGKIFECIKDLVINYIPNDKQKIDILIKEKEIEEREQKILQMKIENLKKLGLNSDEILTFIGFESFHLNKIKELIRNNKINDLQIEKHLEK